jgi:DtxR family Mn-dependent transcriptional regulator
VLSPAEENYLKAIWHHGGSQAEVPMQVLAQTLGTSGPSVTEMARRLTEKGLLTYRPYKGVRFTPQGERLATQIVRRHRIWETFVAQVLGYTGERVHELAEKLEHLSDDEFTERLYAFLGRPARDPHGDEIPAILSEERWKPLSRLAANQRALIRRLPEARDLREVADLLGLKVGQTLKHLRLLPVDHIHLVEYHNQILWIPPSLAETLWVEELP